MGIIDTIKKRKTSDAPTEEAVLSSEAGLAPKKRVAKEKKTEVTAPKGKVTVGGRAHVVLFSPVISEKTTRQEEKNTYTFLVDKKANKIEIKKAIEEVYGVRPTLVRTSITDGKVTRNGRRSDYKKAIITTKKNQKLSIHEGV